VNRILKKYHWFFLLVTMAAASCSTTKSVPQGDALYTGASVRAVKDTVSNKKNKSLAKQLEGLTRPRPNRKFLGMPFKLWMYNLAGNKPTGRGLRGWLKNKVGEPPVLLSAVNLDHNTEVLKSWLENKGYFQAKVTADTTVKGKKASARYKAVTGDQYHIAEVHFPEDDTSAVLVSKIRESMPNTLLKTGQPFDLDVIKAERLRIDDYLKEHGFYFFNSDHLLVKVDSTVGNKKVNLYVTLKPSTPEDARKVYHINDIYIYTAFNLRETSVADTTKRNAVFYDGYYVVDRQKFYKPKLFQRAMPFLPGDIYSRTEQNATINRLINLDLFKFVKNRFEVVPHPDSSLLNAYYYLTRLPKKSLRIELRGSTKSNNLTGSNITVGWKNRNTFRAGEIWTVNANYGFEVQYSGQFRGFNTMRYGIETNLVFPRFLVPFFNFNTRGGYMPRTRASLSYDILNRTKLFSMNSFTFSFGYNWKETARKEHEVTPLTITYVNPINVTQEYIDSAKGNVTLLRAVEKQFILGATYSFTYNDLIGTAVANGFYFNGVLDLSGNIAGLITGANVKKGDTAKIAGAPFSQYAKVDLDFRLYRRIGRKSVWANRLITGFGIPYGNSTVLPYIKQFFSGGNNSVRAFRSRSLGPGSFLDTTSTATFYDQSGDIRLELNSEFRFPIAGILNGAVFVDVGNIWLYNKDTVNKPGGEFDKDFLKDLAVGAGVGLRFDFNFLVLRLDVAIPLRKPWEHDPRWVLKDINFRNPNWRRENIVFNIAIGYPF
jgi:outer membrane protein insertion porin family